MSAKRHVAPARRSAIRTLHQVASRAVRAIEPSGERNADSRRRPRFFAAFPFFWWAKVSTSWTRRLRANSGSGRRLGFGFACDQSQGALCGRAEGSVLLASGRAGARPGRGRARLGRMPLASPPPVSRLLRRLGSWFFLEKCARSVDIKEHDKLMTLKSSRCHVAQARRKATLTFRGRELFFGEVFEKC